MVMKNSQVKGEEKFTGKGLPRVEQVISQNCLLCDDVVIDSNLWCVEEAQCRSERVLATVV